MKLTAALIAFSLLIASTAFAAKAYQLTGPILEVKDDVMLVQ